MTKKHAELTDKEISEMVRNDYSAFLGEHYRGLRDHHIEETTELLRRVPRKGPSILVVGPDGVGKTTLVKRMSEITGIPSFKCPVEKRIFRDGGAGSLVFDYMLTHFIEQTGHRFISDRAYPCEMVYSQVFGRKTDLDLLLEIDLRHQNLGTRILYLYSSVQPEEPDDIVPSDRYWDVKAGYDDFAAWTDCLVTPVDTAEMIAAFKGGGDRSEEFAKICLEKMGIR